MGHVNIESPIGVDRLATWEEVRCAISVTSYGALELVGTNDDFLKTDSDFAGRARNLSEDMMWLAIVGEMPDFGNN